MFPRFLDRSGSLVFLGSLVFPGSVELRDEKAGVRAHGPGGQGWPHGVCVVAWRKLRLRERGHWALALDLDCACPRSVGGGRGAGQAAECVDRAGAGQLSGLCVAAGHGPALGLACMCMPRGVLVGLCAGCRLSKGVGKRAQAPTRDRSQACFFRVIMRAFISLQILPAALVRICACVCEGVRVRGRVGRVYAHVCVRVRSQIDVRAVLAACVPRSAQRRFANTRDLSWHTALS